MSPEKSEELRNVYPNLFSDSCEGSCVRLFGFECSDGWFELLRECIQKIGEVCEREGLDIQASQVKEKYGTLRFYIGGSAIAKIASSIVDDLVSYAEQMSSVICEVCGAAKYGRIRTRYANVFTRVKGGWYKTLCDECAIKLEYPVDEVEE